MQIKPQAATKQQATSKQQKKNKQKKKGIIITIPCCTGNYNSSEQLPV